MIFNFIWNVDANVFEASFFQLKWMTLFLVLGILLGRMLLHYALQKEGDVNEKGKVFNYTLIGAFLSSRLFYFIIFEPRAFVIKPLQVLVPFEWSQGLKYTGAGQFSLIGGVVGVIIAFALYSKLNHRPFLKNLQKGLQLLLFLLVFIEAGLFFESQTIGSPTNSAIGVHFANKIERNLLHLPCCVMRIPNGKNPLDRVQVTSGKTLVHKDTGYQPIIIYLFFTEGATEQLVNEFLVGDVKTELFGLSDVVFEPGDEPLHYTIYEEGKGKYIARIQTIGIARYPVQLFEGISYLILLLLIFFLGRKQATQIQKWITAIVITGVALIHFLILFITDSPLRLIGKILLVPDQYACILLFACGLFILFRSLKMTTASE